MKNIQFISYDLTTILVIAHFLDSAKEQEWNEPIYFGNYLFWLLTSILLITFTIVGIVPVYLGNKSGNWFSIIVGIGGIGAAGYHLPMNYFTNSNTCNNNFSYILMFILSVSCVVLLCSTIKNLSHKDSKLHPQKKLKKMMNKINNTSKKNWYKLKPTTKKDN